MNSGPRYTAETFAVASAVDVDPDVRNKNSLNERVEAETDPVDKILIQLQGLQEPPSKFIAEFTKPG